MSGGRRDQDKKPSGAHVSRDYHLASGCACQQESSALSETFLLLAGRRINHQSREYRGWRKSLAPHKLTLILNQAHSWKCPGRLPLARANRLNDVRLYLPHSGRLRHSETTANCTGGLARAGSKTQPGKESRSANSGAKSPGQLWRGALIVIIGSYPGCPCRTSRGSDIPKQSPGPRVEFRRLAMLIAGPISKCPVIRPNTLRKTRSHTSTYIREPIILPLARVRPPPSSRPPILHHPAADIRARASSIESGGSH